MRLLIVGEGGVAANELKQALAVKGYIADCVQSHTAVLKVLESGSIDSVILDLDPDVSHHLSFIRKLSSCAPGVPVLAIGRDLDVETKVKVLDDGAEDYLPKPFDMRELLARLRVLHRRAPRLPELTIVHENLVVNPAAHTVFFRDRPINLPRREFALLHKLLKHKGRVLSHDFLQQTLYSWSEEIHSNALEVHIHNLRKKLGSTLIKTIRGVGYVIPP